MSYMSVKDAVDELRTATLYNKHHEIPPARLSPDWALVHREEQMRLSGHSSLPSASARSASVPPMRSGSQRSVSPMRSGHRAGSDHWATESSTSSVPSHRYQERGQTSGGFSPRGLNSPSTHCYGAEPLNPGATNNEASRVGSLSMFSSQAMSGKISSASFGFGTATREQSMQLYISPAHMRANHGRFSPGPAAYGGNSSLSRQAHNPSPPTPPKPPAAPLCPSCIDLAQMRAAPLSLRALRPRCSCRCSAQSTPTGRPPLASRSASTRNAVSLLQPARQAPAPTVSEPLGQPCRASCASCACGNNQSAAQRHYVSAVP